MEVIVTLSLIISVGLYLTVILVCIFSTCSDTILHLLIASLIVSCLLSASLAGYHEMYLEEVRQEEEYSDLLK